MVSVFDLVYLSQIYRKMFEAAIICVHEFVNQPSYVNINVGFLRTILAILQSSMSHKERITIFSQVFQFYSTN